MLARQRYGGMDTEGNENIAKFMELINAVLELVQHRSGYNILVCNVARLHECG